MPDMAGQVSRALRLAPPDQLAEAADRAISAALGASRTEVFIADYRSSGLWPVLDPELPDAGFLSCHGVAQRSFSSQRPVLDGGENGRCRVYLPLSVWGERLGVLLVELPAHPDAATVTLAQDIAGELAVALRAADRETDRYRRARRRERLSMAAEMQWDLLPGRSVAHGAFLLAGQLEPAYTVGGDHFDWSVDGDRLTVTVLNGAGNGLAASLLTAVTVNAMRNARRSGGSLVEQAELASDTLFYQHRGSRYVATLLLELDTRRGVIKAVDAGSPARAAAARGHGHPDRLGAAAAAGHVRRDPVRRAGVRGGAGGPAVRGQRRRVRRRAGWPGALRRKGHGPIDAVHSAAAGDRGGWYGDARTARVPRRRGPP